MAERHWVGGTASWDATAGSKWSLTSGGAGGQAVPTAADDVFFDSGSGVVTFGTSYSPLCRSLTCTSGFTGSLKYSGFAQTLIVGNASGGALTLHANMTMDYSTAVGNLQFVSTSDNGGAGWSITTAGKQMPHTSFNGAGGRWKLEDDWTGDVVYNASMTLQSGTLDWNGKTVLISNFFSSYSTTRVLIATGATVELRYASLTLAANIWDLTTFTNMTVTGSSSLTMIVSGITSQNRTIVSQGQALAELRFNYASIQPGTVIVTGTPTIGIVRVSANKVLGLTPGTVVTGTWDVQGALQGYVYQPGYAVTGAYLVWGDTVGNSVTGDIDIRLRSAQDDWTPAVEVTVMAKWAVFPTSTSYAININAAGIPILYWTTAAGLLKSAAATVAPTITNGQPLWLRATLDVNNGAAGRDIKFYTADGSIENPTQSDFTQLGTTVTVAETTSIKDTTASVEVGAQNGSTAAFAKGKYYRLQIRAGLDDSGTLGFDGDLTRMLPLWNNVGNDLSSYNAQCYAAGVAAVSDGKAYVYNTLGGGSAVGPLTIPASADSSKNVLLAALQINQLLPFASSSFEDATTGSWAVTLGSGSLANDAVVFLPDSGAKSLKATKSGSTEDFAVSSPLVTGIVPGATYRASASVRSDTTVRELVFRIDWYDSGDVYISNSGLRWYLTPLDVWTFVQSGDAVAPATAAKAKVACYWVAVPSGEVFNVDVVYLSDKNPWVILDGIDGNSVPPATYTPGALFSPPHSLPPSPTKESQRRSSVGPGVASRTAANR